MMAYATAPRSLNFILHLEQDREAKDLHRCFFYWRQPSVVIPFFFPHQYDFKAARLKWTLGINANNMIRCGIEFSTFMVWVTSFSRQWHAKLLWSLYAPFAISQKPMNDFVTFKCQAMPTGHLIRLPSAEFHLTLFIHSAKNKIKLLFFMSMNLNDLKFSREIFSRKKIFPYIGRLLRKNS